MPIIDVELPRILKFRSMFSTEESEEKRKRIQISEGRKYIMYNLASVPLILLLVLARAIYDVISLLHNRVKNIKPTKDHVSNQYN